MLSQILKKLDLLVEPYEFNIHNRDRNQTIMGGIMSFLILVFSLFYIQIGVFQKQLSNNTSIYAGSRSADTSQFSLNNDNLLFAMEFSTLDGQIISDLNVLQQYFNISVQYIQQQRKANVIGFTRNYTNMVINKCSYNMTEQFNFDVSSFTETQKQNLLCAEGNFNIHGQFYDPYFSYISIDIQVCNQTLNTQCKSIEQINDFISSGQIFIIQNQSQCRLVYQGFRKQSKLQIQQNHSNYFSEDTLDNIFNSSQFSKQERRQSPITLAASKSLCTFYFRSSQNSIYFFAIYADIFTTILSYQFQKLPHYVSHNVQIQFCQFKITLQASFKMA